MQMPAINLDGLTLTATERDLVEACIATQGKNKGRLRASKPKIVYGEDKKPAKLTGEAAYLWRMLAFDLCSFAPHCCMPVCADMDLPHDEHEIRMQVCYTLDSLADKVAKHQGWANRGGTLRWAKAFGVL